MLDGAPRDREGQGDLAVAHPLARELHDLVLARREPAAVAFPPCPVRRDEAAPAQRRPDAAPLPPGAAPPVARPRPHPPAPSRPPDARPRPGPPRQQRAPTVSPGPHRVVGAGQRPPTAPGRRIQTGRPPDASATLCEEAAAEEERSRRRRGVAPRKTVRETIDEPR